MTPRENYLEWPLTAHPLPLFRPLSLSLSDFLENEHSFLGNNNSFYLAFLISRRERGREREGEREKGGEREDWRGWGREGEGKEWRERVRNEGRGRERGRGSEWEGELKREADTYTLTNLEYLTLKSSKNTLFNEPEQNTLYLIRCLSLLFCVFDLFFTCWVISCSHQPLFIVSRFSLLPHSCLKDDIDKRWNYHIPRITKVAILL